MSKYYYTKNHSSRKRIAIRILAVSLFCIGALLMIYIFFPLLSWQIYFAPIFASQNVAAPIPPTTILQPDTIQSLLVDATKHLSGIDYMNASNWFPTSKITHTDGMIAVSSYQLSIPKLNIKNVIVSTVDNDLSSHLVNYGGTAIPPSKGNALIFGHSTLPQLFNPKDYKTIFANAHTLKVGDEILTSVENVLYKYQIYAITIVSPEDTSVLAQNYNDHYLTLITCTPPGTTWKRLVIKSKMVQI